MSFDPPGWRPDRTYPEDVGHDYPDHSRPIDMLGVIRAFRTAGEQMWDQDWNNMQQWLSAYCGHWTHWWREPRAPYYVVDTYKYVADRRQVGDENYYVANGYENDNILITPFVTVPYQPWAGVKMTCAADRLITAFDGNKWKGIAGWHHYRHVVEIAFFASEARSNRRIAAHTVQEPFFVHADGRGCRVRGWPARVSSLIVERNGIKVGSAYKTLYSSGIDFGGGDGLVEFAAGDVITIKTPDDYRGVRYAVAVTLIGGIS